MSVHPKVIIIGLDSVPPALAFERYREKMPNLTNLCRQGTWGPMRSTDPPITIPAWVSMTTGKTPAQLGMYGFRKFTSDAEMNLVTREDIGVDQIWHFASKANQKSVVVSVPLTFPALSDTNISMTTGSLTPSTRSRWASRPSLAKELEQKFGSYIIDVHDFRTTQKERIYKQCVALTKQHFQIFRHLIAKQKPSFAMLVDLGPDRLHHACLRQIMDSHPNSDNTDMGESYYSLLDNEIGETLNLAGPSTVVMVVSDHGVKPLLGSICLNEILIQTGDLVLAQEYPSTPTSLEQLRVDWSQTTAYAYGGYHGKLYLNLKGRQKQGIVPGYDSQQTLRRLQTKILKILEKLVPNGENKFYLAEELYPNARGFPPDATIYLDNLNYRCVGTIGHGDIQIPCNDTGPDDANHDFWGICAMNRPSHEGGRKMFTIYDVFATAMHHLQLPIPADTFGKVIG